MLAHISAVVLMLITWDECMPFSLQSLLILCYTVAVNKRNKMPGVLCTKLDTNI